MCNDVIYIWRQSGSQIPWEVGPCQPTLLLKFHRTGSGCEGQWELSAALALAWSVSWISEARLADGV